MRRSLSLRAIAIRLVFSLLVVALVDACAGGTSFVCGCSLPKDPQILSVLATGQAGSDVGSLDPAHVTGALEYEIAHPSFRH